MVGTVLESVGEAVGVEASDARVWFLAAGQKKVGPMAAARVLARVAQGKVPADARVWRDGMDAWLPLHQVSEFQSEATVVPGQPAAERPACDDLQERRAARTVANGKLTASGERKRARVQAESKIDEKTARKPDHKKSGSKPESKSESTADAKSAATVATKAAAGPRPDEAPFAPAWRFERRDLWRAFDLGVERRRAAMLLLCILGAGAASGRVTVVGRVAGMIHPLLAVPFVLGAGLVSFAASALGAGALSFHSRRQLEDAAPPTIGEAFGHALRHAASLTIPPLALSIAWVAPVLALGLLALLVKIPYLGPIGTGLVFGAHIALGALTLYLLLSAGVASVFAPVVVGFEGTGVVDTFKHLLEFSRRSTARALLWSLLPGMAFVPFALLVLSLTALSLALPLGALGAVAGRDLAAWFASGMTTEAPLAGATVGLVPLAVWIGLTLAAACSVLGSVANSLVSHLYAAGRAGNDERPTRDAVLAASAMKVGEA